MQATRINRQVTANGAALKETFLSALLFAFIVFYWPSKKPLNFTGLPFAFDISYPVLGLVMLFGCSLWLRGAIRVTKAHLKFVILLIMVPLPGLLGLAASGPELGEWRDHLITDDSGSNVMWGFRPFLFQGMTFLFCAPVFARYFNRRMLIAIALGISVHAIWGFAQLVYPLVSKVVDMLPIVAGEQCQSSTSLDTFCKHTVRAVGLTPNPFFYSFLMFSFSALFISRWDRWEGKAGLLLSTFSISRSFVIASALVYLSKQRLYKIALGVLFLLVVFWLSYDWLTPILELRFANDISYGSRSATNILALREFFENGNVFGIGFGSRYYTDSTFASLILGGGLLSVGLYLAAWITLFSEWARHVPRENRRVVIAFAVSFFLLQALVGAADAQPGGLLFFIAFWAAAYGKCPSLYERNKT